MFLASKPMYFKHLCDMALHRSNFFVSEVVGASIRVCVSLFKLGML